VVENKAYLVEEEEKLCGGPQKTIAAAARYIDNTAVSTAWEAKLPHAVEAGCNSPLDVRHQP
jgi:hypothetical protein